MKHATNRPSIITDESNRRKTAPHQKSAHCFHFQSAIVLCVQKQCKWTVIIRRVFTLNSIHTRCLSICQHQLPANRKNGHFHSISSWANCAKQTINEINQCDFMAGHFPLKISQCFRLDRAIESGHFLFAVQRFWCGQLMRGRSIHQPMADGKMQSTRTIHIEITCLARSEATYAKCIPGRWSMGLVVSMNTHRFLWLTVSITSDLSGCLPRRQSNEETFFFNVFFSGNRCWSHGTLDNPTTKHSPLSTLHSPKIQAFDVHFAAMSNGKFLFIFKR